MKPLLLGICALMILSASNASAQTSATQKSSEQLINELLDEVKMLRQEVRRLSAGTVRAQTLLERIRVEQDQVNRLTTELTRLKSQLAAVRTQRIELRAKLPTMQQRFESGVIHSGELEAAKALLVDLDGRENEFATRELQINTELNTARSNLDELNKRLDAVERELQSEPKKMSDML